MRQKRSQNQVICKPVFTYLLYHPEFSHLAAFLYKTGTANYRNLNPVRPAAPLDLQDQPKFGPIQPAQPNFLQLSALQQAATVLNYLTARNGGQNN